MERRPAKKLFQTQFLILEAPCPELGEWVAAGGVERRSLEGPPRMIRGRGHRLLGQALRHCLDIRGAQGAIESKQRLLCRFRGGVVEAIEIAEGPLSHAVLFGDGYGMGQSLARRRRIAKRDVAGLEPFDHGALRLDKTAIELVGSRKDHDGFPCRER